MIGSFANRGTEDLFDGVDSRAARATCPRRLWARVHRKLDQINAARVLKDLAVVPGNRLELLKGDRAGRYSIRVNDQYRVCFEWEESRAEKVEVTDYH